MKTRREIFEERQLRQHSAQIIPFPIAARRGRPDNMQIWRVVRVMCPPRKRT